MAFGGVSAHEVTSRETETNGESTGREGNYSGYQQILNGIAMDPSAQTVMIE
jgi:hypothetical protein